jgi:murein DD-endopeptidase MepM/ murein hydrolase activator NlpD
MGRFRRLCYGSALVEAHSQSRIARLTLVVLVFAASAAPLLGGRAAGQETLSDLKDRMASLQSDLDSVTIEIEKLRTEQEELVERLGEIGRELRDLERSQANLEKRVVAAAGQLYRSGGTDMLEALFAAESFAELSARVELLSRVSERDTAVFITYSRNEDRLTHLRRELADKEDLLAATRARLADESERLQAQFDAVADEYAELKKRLAARAATVSAGPAPAPAAPVTFHGGMACPVAGPVSFIDSWGAPRSGHTHQGVDMMAATGTPIVAVTDGAITYAGYGGSAGNWLVLSGSDGNGYWYMHNQSNLVTGGSVSAGQQIATVGDTGNAAGTPHLHFEYHPGGGAAVNPYPLVAAIC